MNKANDLQFKLLSWEEYKSLSEHDVVIMDSTCVKIEVVCEVLTFNVDIVYKNLYVNIIVIKCNLSRVWYREICYGF